MDPSYGFEGTLEAVAHDPAGIWLSEADAIILRATLVQPIPQVASREETGDLYLNLKAVQSFEVLQQAQNRQK
jgi:predicted aconitase with swiveling domain